MLYRVLVQAIDNDGEEITIDDECDAFFEVDGYLHATNVLMAKKKVMEQYMGTTTIPTSDVDVIHIEAEKVEDNTLIVPDQVIQIG